MLSAGNLIIDPVSSWHRNDKIGSAVRLENMATRRSKHEEGGVWLSVSSQFL